MGPDDFRQLAKVRCRIEYPGDILTGDPAVDDNVDDRLGEIIDDCQVTPSGRSHWSMMH